MSHSVLDRLMKHVEPEPNSGCFLWTASESGGYGRISIKRNGKWVLMLATRLMYEVVNGVDPGILNVLHRCDNPPCVNPDHLFLGTQADNNLDRARKGRGAKSKKGLPKYVNRIRDKYAAQPVYNGKQVYVGIFSDPLAANRAALDYISSMEVNENN